MTARAPEHGGTDTGPAPRLDLSTNANPHGPSPVLAALRDVDVGPYPEPSHARTRELLGTHLGVDPARLVLGTGASELVHRVVRHLGGPVLVRRTTFGEYAHAARVAGLGLVEARDHEHLLAELARARATLVCSPNNPTGEVLDEAAWQALDVHRRGDVVVDLAYAPLHQAPVPAPEWAWHLHAPNKAHGVTGIRAGVLVAPDARAAGAVRTAAASWPVGAHGVAFLEATTTPTATAWLDDTRTRLWHDRDELVARLRAEGIEVHASLGTFVRLEVGDAERFTAVLRAEHGIAVRDATSFALPTQVRVAVPRTEDLDVVVQAVVAVRGAVEPNAAPGPDATREPPRSGTTGTAADRRHSAEDAAHEAEPTDARRTSGSGSPRGRAVAVLGCTSWAGKSLVATALCRWYARQGIDVVPFKAANMSNNARLAATRDGGTGEVGVAQWLQARAAGVAPHVDHAPVLVKPERGTSQVVVHGRVDTAVTALPWRQRGPHLWPHARASLDRLLDEHELVVLEGAGSPAETNLADVDLANLMAPEHADAASLLVADIDRGGAFAHLHGTWALLDRPHRDRLAGFVLNRFRGDATLLEPAPSDLADRTGMAHVGTIPMLEHGLPDEDGWTERAIADGDGSRAGRPVVALVAWPGASNLDEWQALRQAADLHVVRRAADLPHAVDLVVLPGSKTVAADARWLASSGLADAVRAHAGAGRRVLGVCGGMQVLGVRVRDAGAGVDGDADGLGLLDVETVFDAAKHTAPWAGRFADDLPHPWSGLAGRHVAGYEIRHGRTTPVTDTATGATGPLGTRAVLPDGRGWARGAVLGIAVHGLLDAVAPGATTPGGARPAAGTDAVLDTTTMLDALLDRRPGGRATTKAADGLEVTFERLADAVEAHLDTDLLMRLATGAEG